MAFKITKEIKVGIVVTTSLIASIWGINYLKGSDLFSLSNTYYAIYPQVNGLAKSNFIKLNGFKVGQVSHITFMSDNSGRVLVEMNLSSKIFVSKDAQADIVSADFLGTKEIQIILGTDKTPAKDGDTLRSDIQLSMTESLGNSMGPVKDKFESLLVKVDSLAGNLNVLLNAQNKEHLNNSFSSLEVTLKNLEHVSTTLDQISQKGGSLNGTLSNANDISKTIKDNDQQLDKIIDNAAALTDSLQQANLKTTIENLNQTITQLKNLLTKINNGEGSMGKLINDKQLYDNLAATTADMDKLMIDLKANPKRYVHISVFGKKDKAPPAEKTK